ncbi:thioredoxin family protein [uncultured Lacinutrix sp.]|uniref:thioredoxin family protein n=1 Tax=uncultured Lacinutrix sp. TaxID=574032 RepID=UPI00260749BA|nr:thioredoxin family protein [uncultured Lacinutrix sp.]
MKKIITVLLCLIAISNLNAQEKYRVDNHNLKWYVDYDVAREISLKEKKLTLLYFTGSDWCGACKLLEDNYFAKKEFKKLSKYFTLCEMDFPKKTFDKEYVKKHFEKFKRKFEISDKLKAKSYPTIIILDKNENVLGRVVGYLGKDTPKKVTNLIKAIIDTKTVNGNFRN